MHLPISKSSSCCHLRALHAGGRDEADVYESEEDEEEGEPGQLLEQEKEEDKEADEGLRKTLEERLGLRRKKGVWLGFETAQSALMIAAM